jgi:hypothetical protein
MGRRSLARSADLVEVVEIALRSRDGCSARGFLGGGVRRVLPSSRLRVDSPPPEPGLRSRSLAGPPRSQAPAHRRRRSGARRRADAAVTLGPHEGCPRQRPLKPTPRGNASRRAMSVIPVAGQHVGLAVGPGAGVGSMNPGRGGFPRRPGDAAPRGGRESTMICRKRGSQGGSQRGSQRESARGSQRGSQRESARGSRVLGAVAVLAACASLTCGGDDGTGGDRVLRGVVYTTEPVVGARVTVRSLFNDFAYCYRMFRRPTTAASPARSSLAMTATGTSSPRAGPGCRPGRPCAAVSSTSCRSRSARSRSARCRTSRWPWPTRGSRPARTPIGSPRITRRSRCSTPTGTPIPSTLTCWT